LGGRQGVIADPAIPHNINKIERMDIYYVFERAAHRLEFRCARNGDHAAQFNLRMELVEQRGGRLCARLRKVGQWPALADIAASGTDVYKSWLRVASGRAVAPMPARGP
jgi:hypothetical protein